VGISTADVDLFLKRLDKAMGEWKKVPLPKPRPPPATAAAEEGQLAAGDEAAASK